MKKAHARPSLAFGVSRGIKKSFFHGKPNQKGKALLMMGGSRGVRGRLCLGSVHA